jgi:hypothetical protein
MELAARRSGLPGGGVYIYSRIRHQAALCEPLIISIRQWEMLEVE